MVINRTVRFTPRSQRVYAHSLLRGGAARLLGDLDTQGEWPPPGSYFVDINHPNADDSNAGTDEDYPWETIHHACDVLEAGETAWVKNGNYLCETGATWTTPSLNPANSGTPGNMIRFRAYPSHTPYLYTTLAGAYCVFGSKYRDYIEWYGFECYGSNVGYRGAVLWGAEHCVIDRCIIHGFHHPSSDNCDGIRIEKSLDCTFKRNLIYDITGSSINACGVKMYDDYRCLGMNNEVHSCNAGLFHKQGYGEDNVFSYNYVHDCSSDGIKMSPGVSSGVVRLYAHHNITEGCDNVGLLFAGSSGRYHVDSKAYSNTIVDPTSRSMHVETDASDESIDCYNNIIVNGSNNINTSNPSIRDCDHNHFYNTSVGCGSSGDPKFVGGSGPEAYKLQSNSPCKGAGRGGADIGAYETGNEIIGRY